MAITLSGVPVSSAEQPKIIYCTGEQFVFNVVNTAGADITSTLRNRGVIKYAWFPSIHGSITNSNILQSYTITKASITMSGNFNINETPLFYARVANTRTQTLVVSSDISSISLSIYRASLNSSARREPVYYPVEGWEDVPVQVSTAWVDSPTPGPAGFAANFCHEPDTYGVNPFSDQGAYKVIYNVYPLNGNVIPISFEFSIK